MKITIVPLEPGQEEEMILKCNKLDEKLLELINLLHAGEQKLNAYKDGNIFLLKAENIYYFESVDTRVYAYTKSEVFEIRKKLYELEIELPSHDFFRASKSTILNLNVIKSLSPAFGGRFEASLKNQEKVIVSRQYVSTLKDKLGL